ncbi:hypothetical protein [Williamsia sp. 1135]|uniref:hypothetical protein n=1 Tax=Williamsia sp. 1135 TaxID=1889262 RepID=UPI000A108045|nr:hypothetical protein [Williamsia sp. 1135]ORM37956.1 hypothetical protein BFL43_02155 [Williamsia sp. 1135]
MPDDVEYTDLAPTPEDLRNAAALILAAIRKDNDGMVAILEATVDNARPVELIYQLAGLTALIATDDAEQRIGGLLMEIAERGLTDD